MRETHGQTTRDLYYSAAWQAPEEREGSAVKAQYMWSPVYVDAMVLRDADADADNNPQTGNRGAHGSGIEQTLYAQYDAKFNVTSVVFAQEYLPDDKPVFVRGYISATGGEGRMYDSPAGRMQRRKDRDGPTQPRVSASQAHRLI